MVEIGFCMPICLSGGLPRACREPQNGSEPLPRRAVGNAPLNSGQGSRFGLGGGLCAATEGRVTHSSESDGDSGGRLGFQRPPQAAVAVADRTGVTLRWQSSGVRRQRLRAAGWP